MSVVLSADSRIWWKQGLKQDAIWKTAIFMMSLVFALMAWTVLAWWVAKPAFLPSPARTLVGAIELIRSGELQTDVAVSFFRILIGFAIGTAIGVPLGLAMGVS